MLLKICGNRTEADVETVEKSAADYIGFVVDRKGITPEAAAELIRSVDTKKIAVITDSGSAEDILDTIYLLQPDMIQLNGRISLAEIKKLRNRTDIRIARVIPVNSYTERTAFQIKNFIDYLVLDSMGADGVLGGTGIRVDSAIARRVAARMHSYGIPVVLAGGLNSDNIEAAIKEVGPDMVDISSGVKTDGRTDALKIKDIAELL